MPIQSTTNKTSDDKIVRYLFLKHSSINSPTKKNNSNFNSNSNKTIININSIDNKNNSNHNSTTTTTITTAAEKDNILQSKLKTDSISTHNQVKVQPTPTSNILSDVLSNASSTKDNNSINNNSTNSLSSAAKNNKIIVNSSTTLKSPHMQLPSPSINSTMTQATLVDLAQFVVHKNRKSNELAEDDYILEEYSLYIFHRSHWIRLLLYAIVQHQYFDQCVIFMILINCIFLCFEDPDTSIYESRLQMAVYCIEVISTCFYCLETCIKAIVYGFVIGKKSYLHNPWNQIDFIVVCSSLLDIISNPLIDHNSSNILRWMSIGKVMRPLRFLSLVPDLQLLLNQFIQSIPLLSNAFLLLSFLMLIWGLVGVQLFKGKLLYKCANDITNAFDEYSNLLPSQQPQCGYRVCSNGYTCMHTNMNPNFGLTSFDNLGAAVLAIFQAVTMEKWTYLMYRVQDAYSFWVWPYFVLLIMFGSFFAVNLTLVAINAQMLDSEESNKRLLARSNTVNTNIISSIIDISDNPSISTMNSTEFNQWSKFIVRVFTTCIPIEHVTKVTAIIIRFRNTIKSIINHTWFDSFFMLLIMFNTILLTLEHHNQPQVLDKILSVCNYTLTSMFLIEMITKLIGLGIRGYISDTFNIFDGIVAIISVAEVMVASSAGKILSAARVFRLIKVFRMVRVFRVMKLVRYIEPLKRLIWVIKHSTRSIAFISALLLIFIFMYAMLGFQIFRNQFYFPQDVEYGHDSIPRANFETLFWSFITVFQILTLEEWTNVMYNGVRATNIWSIAYFISFIVIGVYCLLNMFLAIVLQNFEADHKKQLEEKIQKERDMQAIKEFHSSSTKTSRRISVTDANHLYNLNHNIKNNNSPAELSYVKTLEKDIADGNNNPYGYRYWRLILSCRRFPFANENSSGLGSFTDSPSQLLNVNHPPVTPLNNNKVSTIIDIKKSNDNHSPVICSAIDGEFGNQCRSLSSIVSTPVHSPSNDSKSTTKSVDCIASTAYSHSSLRQHSRWENIRQMYDRKQNESANNKNKNIEIPFSRNQTNVVPKLLAIKIQEEELSDHIFNDYAWYKKLRNFILCDKFQQFILVLIVISSLNLAIDSPRLDRTSTLKYYINLLDTILVYIFFAEMMIKIFVMGLVGMNGSYLNDNWNKLDFIIVITSLIPKLDPNSNSGNTGFLGTLRVLRAFRPLRIAARYEELRIVLVALTKSIPAMLNVLGVLLIVWIIFGILSVQMFGGKFYDCYETVNNVLTIISNADLSLGVGGNDRVKCISLGLQWLNPNYHFDDIFNAIKSLFVIATLEGWHVIMYHAVDATEVDQQPIKNNNLKSALFFIFFILIGAFFLISLFVGIIFENFIKLRDEATGVGMLNLEQKSWVSLQAKVIDAHPIVLPLPPSLRRLRKKCGKAEMKMINLNKKSDEDSKSFDGCCYYIAISTKFEILMMACICLNTLVMCFSYENEPISWTKTLDNINTVFTFIFAVEASIKLIGFGPKQYFADIWNKFDFFIVVGAIFEFTTQFLPIFAGASGGSNITLLRMLRVFRVSRLVRIIKSAERLKTLMRTVIKSFSSLLSVGALLGLMYFVYAILAMNLFANLEQGDCITSHANFQDFMHALLLMFRVSTGEDWDCIMSNACNPEKGGFTSCWIFFMAFYMIVSFITLNLFIAVILQAFDPEIDTINSLKQMKQQIKDDNIAEFIDAWSYFDPMATGYMHATQFYFFLKKIRKPMGIGQYGKKKEMWIILQSCEIVVHENDKLNFSEVLYSLCERVNGVWLNEESRVIRKINKQLAGKFNFIGDNQPSLGVLLAVTHAQMIWKKRLAKKRMNKKNPKEEECQNDESVNGEKVQIESTFNHSACPEIVVHTNDNINEEEENMDQVQLISELKFKSVINTQ